jgi:hypothetical protein
MQRINAEPSFTDLCVADLGGPRATAFFEVCQRQIPFDRLAGSVADIFMDDGPAGGAPHWPVAMMLKVVFLQKCFALSDPMAEEMLKDRIRFRRFVGLSFDDKTPDHSTISVFRKRLPQQGAGPEAAGTRGVAGPVPPAGAWPEGTDRRAETLQPADRPDPRFRRAPLRMDQGPAEQPPGAIPRGGPQRPGLCPVRDGVQLLSELYA